MKRREISVNVKISKNEMKMREISAKGAWGVGAAKQGRTEI